MSLSKIEIKICSSIKNEGDPSPERTEEYASGIMRCNEDGSPARISYKSENENTLTETALEFYGTAIRLIRRGALESDMLFEPGVEHKSVYKIPPYEFDMSVTAKRTEISVNSEGGTVELEYSMEVGGAKKECVMELLFTKKQS